MEYDKIEEEAIYKDACEKVKKIIKAIKAIKIKYYPNFSRISEEDKQAYQELEAKLEQISEAHGLQALKVELMGEIGAKYDNQEQKSGSKEQKTEDGFLLEYYGAIDAEATALSQGKIKQAMKCQEIRKMYEKQADRVILDSLTKYKREKFAEISQTRQATEQKNQEWEKLLEGFNAKTDVQIKKEIVEIFKQALKPKAIEMEEKQAEEIGLE